MEHYVLCEALHGVARRHLRLDVPADRGGGVGALLAHEGMPGERGFRLAFHLDATLMAHNREPSGCKSTYSNSRAQGRLLLQDIMRRRANAFARSIPSGA